MFRVRFVNANWAAAGDGGDGEFALLIVTEDQCFSNVIDNDSREVHRQ